MNSGSTGRIAEHLGKLIQKNGNRSIITYARGYNPSESEVYKVGSRINMGLHLLKTRLLGNHIEGSYFATRQLISKIDSIQPDLVHVHQVHGYYLNVPLLFTSLQDRGIPVVWTLHDCWSYTGHCSHYTDIDCRKWQTACYACPKFNLYPRSWFFDRSKEEYQVKKRLFSSMTNLHLVAISQWLAGELQHSFLKALPRHTILNGVDTDVFRPIDNAKQDILLKHKINTPNIALVVGTTWNRSKGLLDLIELSKRVDPETTLILLGIPPSIAKSFSERTVCVERSEDVQELARYYSAADVVLSLSYQESFGLTIPEGLACGTPAVVYNNTALSEHIDEQTGVKVQTGDWEGVQQAIRHITAKGKDHYFDHCLSKARLKYDQRKNYMQYMELYDRLIHN